MCDHARGSRVRVLSWNIGLRGIRKLSLPNGLNAVLETLGLPDVLLLQETKVVTGDITPDIAFTSPHGCSYTSYYSSNRDGRMLGGYSGVAVYVKTSRGL